MKPKFKVDYIDTNIIQLLTSGKSNKEISSKVNVPLSTIQRRIRNLITSGLISLNFLIRYESMGFKAGLIYVLVGNGDIYEIAKEIFNIEGITLVEIHIGNFDIIGHIIYEDTQDLLRMISTIRKIKGVKSVFWSERIYQITKKPDSKLYEKGIANTNKVSQM